VYNKGMKQGFFQALSVALYCSLIGVFIWNFPNLFGKVDTFFAPIAFLLLFSTSALICGLLVFRKPYKLFFAGKKKEAMDIVVSTATFLFVFLAVFFTTLFLTK